MLKRGLFFLGMLIIVAVLAPFVAIQPPEIQSLADRLAGPSPNHWFGTDELGRDVFSRVVYGARVSLAVGTLAILLASAIGIFMGALAGTFGGWVDSVIMRCVDVLLCIPTLSLVLILIVFLGPGILNVIIVIALTSWTELARLVRAEILSLREREFILAARVAGAGPMRLMLFHLIPNSLGPVYVSVTFGLAGAILMETGLSFLGLGVQPPTPSWGNILNSGKEYLESAYWLILFPSAAICSSMLSIYMVGEGLREKLSLK